MELMMIIYILIFIIFALIAYSILQLRLAGLNVKDFWSFIQAEKVFNAFDKVPKMIWEEEYEKYSDVLNTYKDIKVLRWASN